MRLFETYLETLLKTLLEFGEFPPWTPLAANRILNRMPFRTQNRTCRRPRSRVLSIPAYLVVVCCALRLCRRLLLPEVVHDEVGHLVVLGVGQFHLLLGRLRLASVVRVHRVVGSSRLWLVRRRSRLLLFLLLVLKK
jgi:hypothetical protein